MLLLSKASLRLCSMFAANWTYTRASSAPAGVDFSCCLLFDRLLQGELHYVEFNGPHVVPAGISQEALLWFTNGQAPVTPN